MIMQKSLSRKHFFILSYFAYASIYIARLNLTIASPVMEEQDLLTSTQIGAMGGAFFLCYSAGQLLNGFLGDLFLPGKMVTAGLLLTALGNILIGFLPPPGVILVLWGVNGFAQSMLWGPLLRELAARFPGKNQAEAASCLVSSVGVGSVLGILIAAAAISFQDVRFAFLLPGLIAALAGGAVCFFFRAPCVHTKTSLAPCGVSVANLCGDPAPAPCSVSGSASGSGVCRSLRARLSAAGFSRGRFSALRSPRLLILLLPAMFHGVLKDNLNLWAASYFADAYGLPLAELSFYVLAIPVLTLLGRLVYPFLLRLCRGREHAVSILALSVTALCLIPLCLRDVAMLPAAVCLSLIAAAVSIVNTSFLTVYPTRYAGCRCVSSVVGLMDFATYFGAGISSILYGKLLETDSYAPLFGSWLVLALLAVLFILIHDHMKKGEQS